MKRLLLTTALALSLFGCGGEAPKGADLAVAEELDLAAASQQAHKQPATVTTRVATKVIPLPDRPAPPEQPASPRTVGQVVGGRYSPGELSQWAGHSGLKPSLRVTALRRLERDDPHQAVTVALEFLSSKTTPRLLRTNAVAVLARSQDRRATPALAKLEPDLQRLAKAVGRPQ